MTQNSKESGASLSSSISAQTTRPVLMLDVALYEHCLADCDLAAEQKQEFLQTLWNIMVLFVDMGFGIEPTQQACGELVKSAFENSMASRDAVESKGKSLIKNFEKAAD